MPVERSDHPCYANARERAQRSQRQREGHARSQERRFTNLQGLPDLPQLHPTASGTWRRHASRPSWNQGRGPEQVADDYPERESCSEGDRLWGRIMSIQNGPKREKTQCATISASATTTATITQKTTSLRFISLPLCFALDNHVQSVNSEKVGGKSRWPVKLAEPTWETLNRLIEIALAVKNVRRGPGVGRRLRRGLGRGRMGRGLGRRRILRRLPTRDSERETRPHFKT